MLIKREIILHRNIYIPHSLITIRNKYLWHSKEVIHKKIMKLQIKSNNIFFV